MSKNNSNQGGINDLLGNLLGNDSNTHQKMACKLQGFDQNDFSIDDISGLMTGVDKMVLYIGSLANSLVKIKL